MEKMENSAGNADKEMEIIMDSLEFKINRLKETGTGIWQNLLDRGEIGKIVDALTKVLDVIDKITSSLGGLGSIAAGVGTIAAIRFFTNPSSMLNMTTAFLALKTALTTLAPVLAVGGALYGAVKIFQALNPTIDDSIKKVETVKSKLDELNSAYADNEERINELKAAKSNGSWTLQNDIEISQLETQNELLKTQIALYESRYETAQKEARENAIKRAKTLLDEDNDPGLNGLKDTLSLYQNAKKMLARDDLSNYQRKAYTKQIETWGKHLESELNEVSDIIGLLNPETDADLIASLNGLVQEVNVALGIEYDKDGKAKKSLDGFKSDLNKLSSDTRKAFMNMENLTEDQIREIQEWMENCGYSADDLAEHIMELASTAEQAMSEQTQHNIGDLASFRDELAQTSAALEAYNAAMGGGEKGDAIASISEIYNGALEDLAAGKLDTNRLHAAAQLFFSPEQLAAMNYDMEEVGRQLQSSMMKTLFDPQGESAQTAGQRMIQYIKDNAAQFANVAQVVDQGNGKVSFWYNSLAELADAFGMSEAAVAAFLDEWDSYGVEVMRSTQENLELIQQFQNMQQETGDATEAVKQFISQLRAEGSDDFAIHDILASLAESGAISMDINTLNQMIAETNEQIDDLDSKDAEASASIDTSMARAGYYEVLGYIQSIDQMSARASATVTTNYVSNYSSTGVKTSKRAKGGKTGGVEHALVNEEGPEIISDNGEAYIANGGKPGFTTLGKGAIVFTAAETAEIFRHAYSDIPLNAYALGTDRSSIRDRLLSGKRTSAHAISLKNIASSIKNTVSSVVNKVTGNTTKTSSSTTTSTTKTTTPTTTSSTSRTTVNSNGYSGTSGSFSATPTTTTKSTTTTAVKRCPRCGSSVAQSVSVCPYCKYDFNAGGYSTVGIKTTTTSSTGNTSNVVQWGTQNSNGSISVTTNVKKCPRCGSSVGASVSVCPYCKYDFNASGYLTSGTKTTTYSPSTGTTSSVVKWGGSTDVSKIQPNTSTGTLGTVGGSGGGSSVGGYGGSGGGSSVGGASSVSQSGPQKIDWVAVRINRIQRAVADLQQVATSGFKKLSTRLDATKKEISEVTTEIDVMNKAYDRYLKEAESVGLSSDLATKVRDGTIDINKYDDDTREKIQEYQEWYEKAIDCKSAIEGLNQTIAQLYTDNFANVQQDYENQLSLIEHDMNMINKDISMAEAKGYLANTSFYENLMDSQRAGITKMKSELSALQSYFKQAMDSGLIEENSESWYDMNQQILALQESIADANTELVKMQKTIQTIKWDQFDYAQERFSQMSSEASFLIDLMSNDQLFSDNGQFNNRGMATVGMRALRYDAAMAQSDAYAVELKSINQEIAQNPYDTDLISRRESLINLQQQSIKAAESEKNAIKDLVSNGIQKELSSLSELIDKYNESLDSAKSLYDYQKKITEKTQDIATIQKQLAAYTGDSSEETRARVQKLNAELKKAQQDLQESEYEQSITEQKKIMDDIYDQYEELMNGRLDDVDALMKEMIDAANANAYDIRTEIGTVSKAVGYTVSSELTSAMNGNLANYNQIFEGITSVNAVLASIYNNVNAMARASGAVKAYAKGGKVTDTGLAILHGTKNRPEMVLNAGDTDNMLQMIDSMRQTPNYTSLAGKKAIFTAGSGVGVGTVSIGELNVPIQIDHVQDYNDMLAQMKADPKFEKLVNIITLDRAVGKSGFRKNSLNI